MGLRAREAPGTRALREAGCRDALAFAADEGMGVLGPAPAPPTPDGSPVLVVVCLVEEGDETPGCEDLADAFARSRNDASSWIYLSVGTPEAPGSRCAGLFDPDLGREPGS